MKYKKLPEPVSITKDGDVQVIGWTGKRSFVINSTAKIEKGSTIPQTFNLDGTETFEQGELMSLWDWAVSNEITVKELDALQKSLETYIAVDEVEIDDY